MSRNPVADAADVVDRLICRAIGCRPKCVHDFEECNRPEGRFAYFVRRYVFSMWYFDGVYAFLPLPFMPHKGAWFGGGFPRIFSGFRFYAWVGPLAFSIPLSRGAVGYVRFK